MGKFKKGDTVFRWGSHGRINSFIAKDVRGTEVQHPHGAWIESFENTTNVKTELFTKEEMIQEINAAAIFNNRVISET